MTTHVKPTHSGPPTAELYFEVRGSGAPVLLIAGTPGDGGQFDELADVLARDHLVVTYDRVGTSRSPAPPAWTDTTVADQADDAARLLRKLVTEPATVYGTSNGAAVALEVALRHPTLVSRAILHEMPLLAVLADPGPVGAMLGDVIGSAMAAGGPRAALDAFLRFAYGDAIVDAWPSDLRARLLANADMAFAIELPAFQAYRPDEAALAAHHPSFDVAVGVDQQAPFFLEAAGWLANGSHSPIIRTPGAHGPHFSDPEALAAMLFPGG
ncbi:MAG TPA: alpha/beta hydrolase [Acidimicrobiales bacterium]|nr:alpha/beta hydrolase [Acidimicrobiales bacterium]